MEDALDKTIGKLITFQQSQQDESQGQLLKMENERFLWEKERERKREERKERWQQERFEQEERKIKASNDLIQLLASMFANRPGQQQPTPGQRHQDTSIPPYYSNDNSYHHL